MKFVSIELTNGNRVEVNVDMIKCITQQENDTALADLVGGNDPILFKGKLLDVASTVYEDELRIKALPLMVSAILQSSLLSAVVNQANGRILGEQIVLEAIELVDAMVRLTTGGQIQDNPVPQACRTVFGGVVAVTKEDVNIPDETTPLAEHEIPFAEGNNA